MPMTTTWPKGSGVAQRYVASSPPGVGGLDLPLVRDGGSLDGDAYEAWVAGFDTKGRAKGRLRTDEHGLRFVEVVVNGPKTWSLAASLHPEIAEAYDAAQDAAAVEIIGWLAEHATTRVGPRGRQVQVPVERLEAAVVRHYTSRAGDPHRHLHLQINARVFAAGRWRGLHSVGVVDSIEALNGIGHAAVMCNPGFRAALAAHGYTLDPEGGEIRELAAYTGAFSARASQINRNVDRYEARWRSEHPDTEPGPGLRRAWDRRAWAEARPDKIVPTDGSQLARRWREELGDLGFIPPAPPSGGVAPSATPIGRIRPGRGRRPRPDQARRAPVELECRRHPRRGRRHHRLGRHRGRRAAASGAGRGPHQPHPRSLRAAADPRRRPRARPRTHLP